MPKQGGEYGSTVLAKSDQPGQGPPTVVYDEERAPLHSESAFDDLDPPDLDAVLRKKRKWYHRITHFELPRRSQMILTGLSIVLSAVQANGVYCWPT